MPSKPEMWFYKEIQDSIIFILETCSFVVEQAHLVCDVFGGLHCRITPRSWLFIYRHADWEKHPGVMVRRTSFIFGLAFTFSSHWTTCLLTSYKLQQCYYFTLLLSSNWWVKQQYTSDISIQCEVHHCSVGEVLPCCSAKCSGSPLLQKQHSIFNNGYCDKGLIILVIPQQISLFLCIQIQFDRCWCTNWHVFEGCWMVGFVLLMSGWLFYLSSNREYLQGENELSPEWNHKFKWTSNLSQPLRI